jgi:hypothetical protein
MKAGVSIVVFSAIFLPQIAAAKYLTRERRGNHMQLHSQAILYNGF